MSASLAGYRRIIAPLLKGGSSMTPGFRQDAQNATLKIIGVNPAIDGEHSLRSIVARSAAALLVAQQGPRCLPPIEKPGMDERQLSLLNEDYEIDGDRFRLGTLTPRQIKTTIIAKLIEQRSAISGQIRDILRTLKRCKHEDVPIIDQL